MSKIELNTSTKNKTYQFEVARIYTKRYTKKLGKSEIHTPSAAKLIFEGGSKITMLILLQPIIQVDAKGFVKIWTSASFEKTTLKDTLLPGVKEHYELIHNVKMLSSKTTLGLSPSEIFERENGSAILDALELLDKKAPMQVGGGF